MENEEYLDDSESLTTEEEMIDDDDTAERLRKAEEIANNQKIRAEKAEASLKALRNKPKETETPKNDSLPLKDIRALQDVHDDDVDDLLDYAKYKGISVAEAKKSVAMQAVLKSKEEERRTAQASNTGGGKRGTSAKTDEQVIAEVNQGNISEDDADIARLAEARNAMRKAKRL
jgi:hypothetical protein